VREPALTPARMSLGCAPPKSASIDPALTVRSAVSTFARSSVARPAERSTVTSSAAPDTASSPAPTFRSTTPNSPSARTDPAAICTSASRPSRDWGSSSTARPLPPKIHPMPHSHRGDATVSVSPSRSRVQRSPPKGEVTSSSASSTSAYSTASEPAFSSIDRASTPATATVRESVDTAAARTVLKTAPAIAPSTMSAPRTISSTATTVEEPRVTGESGASPGGVACDCDAGVCAGDGGVRSVVMRVLLSAAAVRRERCGRGLRAPAGFRSRPARVRASGRPP